jgi:NADPH:quinone reductase-like Zn-dependent oxidoreductase
MRAVGVRAFRGAPELLDAPVPAPAFGEVRVRMEGAGINPFDWKIVDGIFDGHRPHVFPLILGVDGAGTVDAVGPGVRRLNVGDRVFGQFLHDPVGTGTYAEYATVPETNALALIPSALSSWEAAALPTSGMTALDALDEVHLRPGETLLVVGASGGVGSFVVPLAAAVGLRVVAVARSTSHARLRGLGAAETIDAGTQDPVGAVRQAHADGVAGLLDVVSDASAFARWASLVRPGGTAASTVFVAGKLPGAVTGVRTLNIDLQPRASLLDRLAEGVIAHKLRSPVERTIALSEAPSAVAESRAGRSTGKTVIRLGPDAPSRARPPSR